MNQAVPNVAIPAIIGPTCTGKSALACRIAECAPVVIVNVDAALVYRGLDIGTAKPDQEERDRHWHCMLDLINPDEHYSAWRYRHDLIACLADIRRQKMCPLLVGGSMFYFLALMTGLPGASTDENARKQVEQLSQALGTPELYQHLLEKNADAATEVHRNDRYRIVRALEKEYASKTTTPGAIATYADTPAPPLSVRGYFLAPKERSSLDDPIRNRLHGFFQSGLVEEVALLIERWQLNADHPSMRLVAYRQVFEHLAGRSDARTMEEKAFLATRGLCKRQYTWMRSGRLGTAWFTDSQALEQRLRLEVELYLKAQLPG